MATGFLWALVGAVFSHVARQNVNFVAFLFVSSLFNAIGAWLFLFKPNLLSGDGRGVCLNMVAVMATASLFGCLGFQLMGKAMQKGNRGVIWAMSQSAMILPFFTAVLFFNEKPGGLNWLGIVLILAGLALFGIKKGAADKPDMSAAGWLWMAYTVFLLVGISLSLTILPSHWKSFHDDAGLRVPVYFTASMLYFLAQYIAMGKKRLTRRIVALGLIYSTVVFLGQFFLYRSLDSFATSGKIGMVYPVAIGICVVLFFIYSVLFLKDEIKGGMLVGMLGIIGGVLLLAL